MTTVTVLDIPYSSLNTDKCELRWELCQRARFSKH